MSAASAEDGPFTKFGRGMSNIVLSPRNSTCSRCSSQGPTSSIAIFGGIAKGLVMFVAREVVEFMKSSHSLSRNTARSLNRLHLLIIGAREGRNRNNNIALKQSSLFNPENLIRHSRRAELSSHKSARVEPCRFGAFPCHNVWQVQVGQSPLKHDMMSCFKTGLTSNPLPLC
jgi:hypothetical protein